MPTVQLEADIKLGLLAVPTTNYSQWFHEFIPKITREEIVEDPTYDKAQRITVLGASQGTVSVKFKSSHAAASFWGLAYEAHKTPDGILFFLVKFDRASPIGPDNPEWGGKIKISTLDLGAAAGAKWVQTQTFPAEDIVADTVP